MSDTIQGLPASGGQPTGITPTPGQPPVTAPNPAPAQPAGTPPAAPATPTPPAPDPAKLQKDLEEAQRYNRALQSQKDQAEARLRAMAGVQQPVDHMAARVKAYTDEGYSEKDARFMIGQIDMAVQPLQQQNQQLHAQMQGNALAQEAYTQAVNANPALFSDPKIAETTWRALSQAAMQGDPRFVTPQYAEAIAAQEYALIHKPWQGANTPPPPTALPGYVPRVAMGFGGPGQQVSGLPTAPVQQQDPNIATLADQMSVHLTGKTLSQRSQTQQ